MTNELLIEKNETTNVTQSTWNPSPFLQLPLFDAPAPADLTDSVVSQSTEIHSSSGAKPDSSQLATAWVRRVSRDANSSDLVNFPFALTVSIIFSTGLGTIGWGIILANAWIYGTGFLVTLGAGAIYGLSHSED